MSFTVTKNKLCAPIYWLRDSNRPKDEKPTVENVRRSCAARCKDGKKPNCVERGSVAEWLGGSLLGGGFATYVISSLKQAKSLMTASGLVSAGGFLTYLTGLMNKVNIDGVELESATPVSRPELTSTNEQQNDIVTMPGYVPVSMVRFSDDPDDPNKILVNSGGIHAISDVVNNGQDFDFNYQPVNSRSELDAYRRKLSTEILPKAKNNELLSKLITAKGTTDEAPDPIELAAKEWMPKSIIVPDLKHKVFRLGNNEHEIDVFIPEAYTITRPKATEEIIGAMEKGLSELPSNLIGLVKKVKLNMGRHGQSAYINMVNLQNLQGLGINNFDFSMYTNVNDESISIYHGSYDGPKDELDRREKRIVEELKLTNEELIHGEDTITINALFHEVGHLLREHIANNPEQISTPMLDEYRLTLDGNFAGYDWNNANDAWIKVVRMDENGVSKYGNSSPNEDFCEAVAAYISNKKQFEKLCPSRCKFLDEVIKQVNVSQRHALQAIA